MSTPTKRKRGHAKRKWSEPFGSATGRNFPDSVTEIWRLWQKWQRKQQYYADLKVSEKMRLAAAYVAGYRAGKEAK